MLSVSHQDTMKSADIVQLGGQLHQTKSYNKFFRPSVQRFAGMNEKVTVTLRESAKELCDKKVKH